MGRDDDFFELGGNSLLATRLLARIRDRLHADVPLASFYARPVLHALASLIDAAGGEHEAPIARRAPGTPPPLSIGQERLWFLDRMVPGSPLYNIAAAFQLAGDLDLDRFARALGAVVARHEVLLTSFPSADGIPGLAGALSDRSLRL